MEEKKTNNRIILWDNYKGILILSVVVGHFAQRIGESETMRVIYILTYMFHMPMFMLVSGMFSGRAVTKSRGWSDVLDCSAGCLLLSLALKALIFIFNRNIPISFAIERTAAWYLTALAFYYPVTFLLKGCRTSVVLAAAVILGILIGFVPVGYQWNISRAFVMFPSFSREPC